MNVEIRVILWFKCNAILVHSWSKWNAAGLTSIAQFDKLCTLLLSRLHEGAKNIVMTTINLGMD